MQSSAQDCSFKERAAAAWRGWYRKRLGAGSAYRRDPRLVADLARDLDIAPQRLAAAAEAPGTSEQLTARLRALQLDPIRIGARHPGVLRDMQLGCGFCSSRSRCGRDLEDGAEDPAWRDYCPNSHTLLALQAGERRPN